MAEANRSIPQIPTIRITTAAHVLAQFRARQAVKDQLRKQGLKVSHYAARDITAMACERRLPDWLTHSLMQARGVSGSAHQLDDLGDFNLELGTMRR